MIVAGICTIMYAIFQLFAFAVTKMEGDKAVHLLFSLYDLFQSDIQNDGLSRDEFFGGNGSDKYPRWIPVGNANELKENTAYKYAEEGEVVLICKTDGNVYAVKNCCGSRNSFW